MKHGGRMTRREALGAMGALGAMVWTGCAETGPTCANNAMPACTDTPFQGPGPYFVEEMLNRSDLTSGTTDPFVTGGLPLILNLQVLSVCNAPCPPLVGAQVDVWQANAEGVYSDEAPAMTQTQNTIGEKYLRGYQITDAEGKVSFKTIYPGWYAGRTNHIHIRVRTFAAGATVLNYTTLLLFDDAITDTVMNMPPYQTRGARTIKNFNDEHQAPYGVAPFLIALQPASGAGYVGTFTLAIPAP